MYQHLHANYNQVLDKYGYAHKALASFKTQRIRKDTSDPLGLKDETMPKEHNLADDTSDLTFQEREFLRNKERVEQQEDLKQKTQPYYILRRAT
ncbi:hypothetical protein M758_7G121800 [Ceratodon purpureus]|nr:hypothetical protein KC19_7G155800 [Ceratodon purpureus]KAG0611179.1 hypothetical protein M758_7G121600 [Ceratodon purpureus]KAG0611181.1 hypothetical protein M758_7G121800 [Ceratodon purpureus]